MFTEALWRELSLSDRVSRSECEATRNLILSKIKEIATDINTFSLTLYGSDKRNGLVKDVNILKERNHLMQAAISVVIGIIASVITSLIVTRVLS